MKWCALGKYPIFPTIMRWLSFMGNTRLGELTYARERGSDKTHGGNDHGYTNYKIYVRHYLSYDHIKISWWLDTFLQPNPKGRIQRDGSEGFFLSSNLLLFSFLLSSCLQPRDLSTPRMGARRKRTDRSCSGFETTFTARQ